MLSLFPDWLKSCRCSNARWAAGASIEGYPLESETMPWGQALARISTASQSLEEFGYGSFLSRGELRTYAETRTQEEFNGYDHDEGGNDARVQQ